MKFRIKHVEGKGYYLEVKEGWLDCWLTVANNLETVFWFEGFLAMCDEEEAIQRKELYLEKNKVIAPPKTTYTYL